jgi:rubrerythrin
MATTTLAQAVRNSVKAKRAAESFYRTLAAATKDIQARDFMNQTAMQESDHARVIERFGEGLATGSLSIGADWNVEAIETSPEWTYHQNITYEQALEIALENEQHAELFYDALADSVEGSVSVFFRNIAYAERDHFLRLKKVIEKRSK